MQLANHIRMRAGHATKWSHMHEISAGERMGVRIASVAAVFLPISAGVATITARWLPNWATAILVLAALFAGQAAAVGAVCIVRRHATGLRWSHHALALCALGLPIGLAAVNAELPATRAVATFVAVAGGTALLLATTWGLTVARRRLAHVTGRAVGQIMLTVASGAALGIAAVLLFG